MLRHVRWLRIDRHDMAPRGSSVLGLRLFIFILSLPERHGRVLAKYLEDLKWNQEQRKIASRKVSEVGR
jgi:hypothetical protein